MPVTVRGKREAIAVFKRLPIEARRLVNGEATKPTAEAVLALARSRVPVRSGALRDHLGMSMSHVTGRAKVGIRKGSVTYRGRVHTPSKIGHLQEFGAPQHAAQPFQRPAAEAQREPYLSRIHAAGAALERVLGRRV